MFAIVRPLAPVLLENAAPPSPQASLPPPRPAIACAAYPVVAVTARLLLDAGIALQVRAVSAKLLG